MDAPTGDRKLDKYLRQRNEERDDAAATAADATATGQETVVLPVPRKASDTYVASLNDAMESCGYKFFGWIDKRHIQFRSAQVDVLAEQDLRKAALFEVDAAVIADAERQRIPISPVGRMWLTLTPEYVALGHGGETKIPLANVLGYQIVRQNAVIEWGVLLVDAAYPDSLPPTAFVFSVASSARDNFTAAMNTLEIRELHGLRYLTYI